MILSFFLFHSNVRSLRKNLNQLLACISRHQQAYDIIAVSETWLQNTETALIPGYIFSSLPRVARTRGGGVAFFVKEDIVFEVVHTASISDEHIEALFIKLPCSLISGVVYRPPSTAMTPFLDKFESVLVQITHKHTGRIVILGDFNIDLAWDTHNDYTLLLESFSLHNIIREPTRITSTSSTLIDHALCNIDSGVCAGVYSDPIADHLPIFVVLQNQSSVNANLCPKIRTKVNYVLLRSILEQTNFYALYNHDINNEYQNFVHTLKNAAIQSAESRTNSRYGEPVCPWMTIESNFRRTERERQLVS